MLELVIGEKQNPLAADTLIEELQGLDYDGTLYIGYPIISSYENTIFIDALLTTIEHGVVIFSFSIPHNNGLDRETLKGKQDSLYNALYQKFLQFKPLQRGRGLALDINVVTVTPEPQEEINEEDLYLFNIENIGEKLSQFDPIPLNILRAVNAAVQRVTTIKPAQKRTSVKREDSKGGVIKKIEKEIANLDQWQKKAAIETPEGPQRIRGLAGSGKTVVLALKAAYLHTKYPDWKIVVTFHTRSLYQQFRDLIRRFTFEHIQDEPDWDNLILMHAWGSRGDPGVYSEIALSISLSPENFSYGRQKYGYDKAFDGVCKELLSEVNEKGTNELFDVILIDEAQDFPQAFFELAYLFTRQPKRIIWAYDELQNLGVYRMSPPSELFGVDNDGNPRVSELRNIYSQPKQDIVLPVCYRNTPWALTIAHSLGFGIYRDEGLVQFFDDQNLWSDIGYDVISGELKSGQNVELRRSSNSYPQYFDELLSEEESVRFFSFDSESQQYEWLAENIHKNITEDELGLNDILVILANPITANKKAGRVINYLEERDIPAHMAGVTTSRDLLFTQESVALANIYRAKGNEAPMVYLVNSEYCFAGVELIKRRNILFTAITRSRAWVRVSGVGERMNALIEEANAVRGNDYSLKFTVPTPPQLEEMRQIHRDMTDEERRRADNIEKTLEDFANMIEEGQLSLENIPPNLREKLIDLFIDHKNDS